QLKMRQAADVIQVQSVSEPVVVDSRDVMVSEGSRLRQIVHRIGVRQSGRKISRPTRGLQGKIQLRGAQFHVVVPDVLGIAVKRSDGKQATAARAPIFRRSRVRKRSVRQRENV